MSLRTSSFFDDISSSLATIRSFSDVSSSPVSYISLGQNCSTAMYLKKAGLKSASYPFDWVFSSPQIVEDCISDDFDKYLDKRLMRNKGGRAGHFYHSSFFNHRNPLASKKDYEYHVRCCERFLEDLGSLNPTFYFMTFINEPEKRTGWKSGFGEDFKLPANQSWCDLSKVMRVIRERKVCPKFVVIDHYTEQEREVTARVVGTDILEICFRAAGTSSGVLYRDPVDDFLYTELIKGFGRSE